MDFPASTVERVRARQGSLHPYRHLDPAKTAFVIVDMQNYFTQPGYMAETPASRATFDKVNEMALALRDAGGTVVWIQTSSDGADRFWSRHHSNMLTPERSARRLRELHPSHAGYAIAAGLDARADDLRIEKRTFSALVPGSSSLHEQLQARGIENLLIGGTATNVCCESTARDAMMMNYTTIMVEDALSASTPHEHENSLNNWMLYFGDVLSVADVRTLIAAGRT